MFSPWVFLGKNSYSHLNHETNSVFLLPLNPQGVPVSLQTSELQPMKQQSYLQGCIFLGTFTVSSARSFPCHNPRLHTKKLPLHGEASLPTCCPQVQTSAILRHFPLFPIQGNPN